MNNPDIVSNKWIHYYITVFSYVIISKVSFYGQINVHKKRMARPTNSLDKTHMFVTHILLKNNYLTYTISEKQFRYIYCANI